MPKVLLWGSGLWYNLAKRSSVRRARRKCSLGGGFHGRLLFRRDSLKKCAVPLCVPWVSVPCT